MGLNIGVASEWIGENVGGLERYATSLIRSLTRIDERNRYNLYVTPRGARSLQDLATERIRIRPTAWSSRWYYVPLGLPIGVGRHPIDVLHTTFTVVPWCPARRVVLTIHDVCPAVHPEYFPPAVRRRLRWFLARGVKKATRIVVPSAATLRELHEHYDVDEAKVSVIHEGVSPVFLEGEDDGVDDGADHGARACEVPDEFLLYVGRFHARKNLERLLEAFALLRARRRGGLRLVLAGRDLWNWERVQRRIHALKLQDQVICPGYVSDGLLARLYRRARGFVFPSLHEGFGLPPLEAMARGLPVMASNVSAMPEVLGDAALLVDPFSPEALAAGLERLLDDGGLRDELIRLGHRRVKQLSWESAARKTLRLYEDTVSEAN